MDDRWREGWISKTEDAEALVLISTASPGQRPSNPDTIYARILAGTGTLLPQTRSAHRVTRRAVEAHSLSIYKSKQVGVNSAPAPLPRICIRNQEPNNSGGTNPPQLASS